MTLAAAFLDDWSALINEIFKRSQLEECLQICVDDDEQRRCIVHYDTPS